MQEDFHYYATYCAAYLAGYTHEEALDIAYSAQFVDLCSRTFLTRLKAPPAAATTQLQLELMDARTDLIGLQDITRIWASFHFLPKDLYAEKPHCSKRYLNKYRLICGPNGALLEDTVRLAKDKGLQAAGIAMHVLADTWAHSNFAGTPSLVINNTNTWFYELVPSDDGGYEPRQIAFRHSASEPDDIEKGLYTNSIYQYSESSIMNLGHGRAGHFPDYSFAVYRYVPAWGEYEEILKDNPSDYYKAFCQMVFALQYLRGSRDCFEKEQYAFGTVEPYKERIEAILKKRQIDGCADWKAFGEDLSGQGVEAFDLSKYENEFALAGIDEKDTTFLGRFVLAAMAQKSMVTNKIFMSGNLLAGLSVDIDKKGFRGIRDYNLLLAPQNGGHDESC